eukprot:c18385_g3_i1 orf=261-590(-)
MVRNNLTGVILSGLSSNLLTLLLAKNNLNGCLRSLIHSLLLVSSLILPNNSIDVTLPDTVEGLSDRQILALGKIYLCGYISEWLKKCTKLQVLDLSWNCLERALPSLLG